MPFIKTWFGVSTVAALLAGCAGTYDGTASNSVQSAPIDLPERDIPALAMKLAGADILSMDRLDTLQPIGKNCELRPLPTAKAVTSDKLNAAIKQAREYSEAQKGVSLMILKDGEIIHESYTGEAGPATLTDSFSMMKSVTGLVTGIAMDEGIIGSTSDPVGKYITEWRDDPRGKISLDEFLTMSSGLENPSMMTPLGQKLLLSNNINGVALDYKAISPAGSEFIYNNVNSQIAGIVVDRAVRMKGYGGFTDYMEKKLWCPLGNDTANLWLDRNGGAPRYYAGMYAKASDWARIGELIRNGGSAHSKQIVSQSWLTSMTKPSAANPAYGKQIWLGKAWENKRRYSANSPMTVLHSEPYAAEDVFFFDGFGGQRVYIVPSKGLTIVRTGFVNFAYDDSKIVNLVIAGME